MLSSVSRVLALVPYKPYRQEVASLFSTDSCTETNIFMCFLLPDEEEDDDEDEDFEEDDEWDD